MSILTAWPSSLSALLTSGYIVKKPGLLGAWNADKLSAAPNGERMIDLSGNSRHLLAYGPTPVAGLVGKALSFNGTSYLKSEKVLDYVPDVWQFHIRFPLGNAQSTNRQSLFMYGLVSQPTPTPGIQAYRNQSTDHLYIVYGDGVTTYGKVLPFISFFIGYSTSRIDIAIRINWTSSPVVLSDGSMLPAYAVQVYRNGLVFGTQIMTTPVKPPTGNYLYWGSYNGSLYFLSGIAEGFRMYDPTLALDTPMSIYSRPSLYEALPAYPDATGLSSQPMDGTIRTSMDSGPAKLRRRFTATPDVWAMQYTLSTIQKQILDQFYADQGGVNSFSWTKPDTGETVAARFKGRPAYQASGLLWTASVNLEIMP